MGTKVAMFFIGVLCVSAPVLSLGLLIMSLQNLRSRLLERTAICRPGSDQPGTDDLYGLKADSHQAELIARRDYKNGAMAGIIIGLLVLAILVPVGLGCLQTAFLL